MSLYRKVKDLLLMTGVIAVGTAAGLFILGFGDDGCRSKRATPKKKPPQARDLQQPPADSRAHQPRDAGARKRTDLRPDLQAVKRGQPLPRHYME